LIQATSSYQPGGGASSNPSAANVTSTVDNICTGSASSACPDSTIRGTLGDFYAACSAELTSNPVPQVRNIYDVLYVITPLKQAICSKDDSGNYCILDSNTTSTQTDYDQIQQSLSYPSSAASLSRRGEDAILANLTTFNTNNLPFMFRQPSMNNSVLCTTCTRNIVTGYFNYESSVLYASGLNNSQLLQGQTPLVGAIQDKCGANFLSGSVAAAGGIKTDFNGAVRGVSDRFAAAIAVVAGGLMVTIASFL
jgi:hypothetical protein